MAEEPDTEKVRALTRAAVEERRRLEDLARWMIALGEVTLLPMVDHLDDLLLCARLMPLPSSGKRLLVRTRGGSDHRVLSEPP